MLFLREYNFRSTFNPSKPICNFSCCFNQCYSFEYNIEVGCNGLISSERVPVAGMKPLLFSVKEATQGRNYWVRSGTNIFYHKNHYRKPFTSTSTTSTTAPISIDEGVCACVFLGICITAFLPPTFRPSALLLYPPTIPSCRW